MKNFKKVAALLIAVVLVLSCFAACDLKITPEQKILGSWRDSTGTMGYEFKEAGACVITFADVNLPLLGNINTSVNGAYTTNKGEDGNYYITINYTLFTTTMTDQYMFTVDGSTLTLTDLEDGTSTVLIAYTDPAVSSTESTSAAS